MHPNARVSYPATIAARQPASRPLATMLLASLVALTSACGGGGSTATTSPGGTTTTTTTTTTGTTTTTTPVVNTSIPVIVGVAATGTPLLSATIKIVDGAGLPVALADGVGNPTANILTNAVDGSYRLSLVTAAPVMPLFIEAVGRDPKGAPVVLHSVLQTNIAPALATANITPITDAIVAEIIGGDPRSLFQKASSNVPTVALLGNATMQTAVSDQLKTIIATSLTDAKVTNKAINFFTDPLFVADKTLVDGVLEGVRIQLLKDGAGKDFLAISNKLTPAGTAEVKIDLAAARLELAKTTGGSLASAITSTLKVISTTGAALTNVGTLDTLQIALNKLIAQGSASAAFAPMVSLTPTPTSPAPPVGTTLTYIYSGRTQTLLQQKLADYAKNNYQFGKFQVTGCADDPVLVTSKLCTYIKVSSNITTGTGKLVEIFNDVVVYNKATAPTWLLAGNGRATEINLYPVAYANFGFDGKLLPPAAPAAVDPALPPELAPAVPTNPSSGIQIVVRAINENGTLALNTAIAQMPSGYSVRLVQCAASVMCISPKPATPPTYTGELDDTLFQKPVVGWVGNKDGTAAAKYLVSTFVTAGRTLQPEVYLPADVPLDLSLYLMPVPDVMKDGRIMSTENLLAAGTISWADWAAANQNMKIFMVRRIVNLASGAPIINDSVVPADRSIAVTTTQMTVPSTAFATTYQLWLGAEDNLGRRYFSKISTVPVSPPVVTP